jgi:hypothetical protein
MLCKKLKILQHLINLKHKSVEDFDCFEELRLGTPEQGDCYKVFDRAKKTTTKMCRLMLSKKLLILKLSRLL